MIKYAVVQKTSRPFMHLDSIRRDSVMFLGVAERTVFRAKATAFQVSYPTACGPVHYLVTTEQVILDLLHKGHSEIMFRGTCPIAADFSIPISHWFFHPDADHRASDVAVAQLSKMSVGASAISVESFISDSEFSAPDWGVGASVAVVGLFRNHYGRGKNIPVARVGNIAALLEEPIRTERGEMDSILVELQSTGGLSGSPVYIGLPNRMSESRPECQNVSDVALLGLLSGRFMLQNPIEDAVVEKSPLDAGEQPIEAIHSGMGIVIPAHKILETINRIEFSDARSEAVDKMTERKSKSQEDLSTYLPLLANADLEE